MRLRTGRVVPVALLGAALAVVLALPAWAAVSFSPTEVDAGASVTLTITASVDTPRITQRVDVGFPAGFTADACGAPDGWTCNVTSGDGVLATYERSGSLNPTDTNFALSITAPLEPADYGVETVQTYGDGSSTSATRVLTVVAPEPAEEEPTEEPTAEPSPTATPSPTETEAPPARPAEQEDSGLTPLRPPDEDSPITAAGGDDGDDGDESVGAESASEARPRRGGDTIPSEAFLALAALMVIFVASTVTALANR